MKVIGDGVVFFGLRPAEVEKLTLAQYDAMIDANLFEQSITDHHLAWLRYLVAAPNRDNKSHPAPFHPSEFALFDSTAEQLSKKREQTPEEMLFFVTNTLHPHFEERHRLEMELEEGKQNG